MECESIDMLHISSHHIYVYKHAYIFIYARHCSKLCNAFVLRFVHGYHHQRCGRVIVKCVLHSAVVMGAGVEFPTGHQGGLGVPYPPAPNPLDSRLAQSPHGAGRLGVATSGRPSPMSFSQAYLRVTQAHQILMYRASLQ